MSSAPTSPGQVQTFRLPRVAYLIVLFLLFCVIPLAFASDTSDRSHVAFGPRALLLVIPALAAVFIARTSTTVKAQGILVKAVFGSRLLPWDDVRGLSLDERTVYAVCVDGSVRLPCVRVADLAAVSAASGGRLPDIAQARPKYAPSRRRR